MTALELSLWLGGSLLLTIVWYALTLYIDSTKRKVKWRASDLIERRRLLAVPIASQVVLTTFIVMWMNQGIAPTYMARILLFTSALFAIAALDYKYHIIPNKILIFLLAARVIVMPFELAADPSVFFSSMRRDLLTTVVVLVFLLVMKVLQRGGLGTGDLKLLTIVPIFYGSEMGLTAIIASFIVMFLVSGALLLSKRATLKDGLPFAPSMLAGSVLVIVFLSLGG